MTDEKDKVVELDLGCSPEAAVSGALLLQSESCAYLTFNAVRPGRGGLYEAAGTAVVEIVMCGTTKFGYPNDEALAGHPLYSKGVNNYGIYEVLNSSWVSEQEGQNRVSFPDRTDMSGVRHFIITFHDSTFECLAEDIKLTLSNEPYGQIFGRVSGRVIADEI
jgi:hypothetical protein